MSINNIIKERQILFNNALYLTLAKLSQDKLTELPQDKAEIYRANPCDYLPQIIKVEDGKTDFKIAKKIIKKQHEDFAKAMDDLKAQNDFYEQLKKKIDNIIELNNDYKEMYEKYNDLLKSELSNETRTDEINKIKKELEEVKNKLDQNKENIDFLNSKKNKFKKIIKMQKREIDKFTNNNRESKVVTTYKINNENYKLKQVDNFYYINNLEDEGTETEIYNNIIEKNKNNTNVIFYRMVSTNHWRLLAQQGKTLMLIEPAAARNTDINYEPIEKQILKSNNKDCKIILIKNKIQYSSGCCELYSIALPFIINRYMIFNNIASLKYVFKNESFPSILKTGLSEEPWGNLGGKNSNIDSKENVITKRINIIVENTKTLKDQSKINYNTSETFNDKFIKVLKTEEQYLQNLKGNEYLQNISSTEENGKILPNNIKGGFFYVYRYILGMKVSERYKDFIKEYFFQNLKKLTSLNINDKDETFFKNNFDTLLNKFYKKFWINEQRIENKTNSFNYLDRILQAENAKISTLRKNLEKLKNKNDKITSLKKFFKDSEKNKRMDTLKKFLEKENISILFKNKINDYIAIIKDNLDTYFNKKKEEKTEQNIKPTNNKNEVEIQKKKLEFILDNILSPANMVENDLNDTIALLNNVVNNMTKEGFNINNLYNDLTNNEKYFELLIKISINYINNQKSRDKKELINYLKQRNIIVLSNNSININFESNLLNNSTKIHIKNILLDAISKKSQNLNDVKQQFDKIFEINENINRIKNLDNSVLQELDLKDISTKDIDIINDFLIRTENNLNTYLEKYINIININKIEALIKKSRDQNLQDMYINFNIKDYLLQKLVDINGNIPGEITDILNKIKNKITENDVEGIAKCFLNIKMIIIKKYIKKSKYANNKKIRQLFELNLEEKSISIENIYTIDNLLKNIENYINKPNIDNNRQKINELNNNFKAFKKIINIIDKIESISSSEKNGNVGQEYDKLKIGNYLSKINLKDVSNKNLDIINNLLENIKNSIDRQSVNNLKNNFVILQKTIINSKIESILSSEKDKNKKEIYNQLNNYLKTLNLKDISNKNLDIINKSLENIKNSIDKRNIDNLKNNFKMLEKIINIINKIKEVDKIIIDNKQKINSCINNKTLSYKICENLTNLDLNDILKENLDTIDNLLKNINGSLKNISKSQPNPEVLREEAQNIINNFVIFQKTIINSKIESILSSEKDKNKKEIYNQLNNYLKTLNLKDISNKNLDIINKSLENIKNSIDKRNIDNLQNNFETLKTIIESIPSNGEENVQLVDIPQEINDYSGVFIPTNFFNDDDSEDIDDTINGQKVNDSKNNFEVSKEDTNNISLSERLNEVEKQATALTQQQLSTGKQQLNKIRDANTAFVKEQQVKK